MIQINAAQRPSIIVETHKLTLCNQALKAIDANIIDVAMLDVNLNGTKSYPVADALAARGVPFLFATGYSDHGLNGGYPGRPVLKKPFQFQQLVDGLRRLLLDNRAAAL